LVVFTSDNGGAWGALNGGLKGGKRSFYEGGIRVPGIFSWPEKIRPNSDTQSIGHTNDLLPTLCAVAGTKAPEDVDGVDLSPVLEGKDAERSDLFWASSRVGKAMRTARSKPEFTHVVRRGDYKLCQLRFGDENKGLALYHIGKDSKEENNLIADPEYAPMVASMQSALEKHLKEPSLKPQLADGKKVHVLE
jgi:arylsulfatase A-like enzyme